MKLRQYILALALIPAASFSLCAQSFQQGLFLDCYRLGYRYNPAIQNEGKVLSVGEWDNQTRNNFGAASFLYPREEGLVTALHSSVSADEFLGSLQDRNYFTGDINFNLFSYGWRKDAAYHTIEASVRGSYGMTLPKELFSLLKLGTTSQVFDMSNLKVSGNAYAEIAYGYSRKISDAFSVGARAKLLVGVEALNYNFSRLQLQASEESYKLGLTADLDLTSRWSKIRPDENGTLSLLNLSSKERWRGPSGAGLALDLGVVLTPVEGLTLSASLLDFGGILWYYGNAGRSDGTVTFTGVKDLSLEQIQNKDLLSQFNGIKNELLESLSVKTVEKRITPEMVPMTVNLAAKYEMPFYRALSIGATGNFIFRGLMSYREVRGHLAWNPGKYIGITADGGYGTLGAVYGLAMNAKIGNFRITAAMSNGFGGTMAYSSLPLKANNKVATIGLTYDL